MCGIFGVFNFNKSDVKEADLKKMGDLMFNRGPDDAGYYIDKYAGVGMRRLSIIDIDGGHQPISNKDDSIQIVMNGEIYNYKELREELLAKNYEFKTDSDVEVVIHLYEEMGKECVHMLNGMFSFAIYDKNKESIWLVRDRLGIKPLFYFKDEDRFIFSSDLTALNGLLGNELDLWALTLYLGYSYIPAPHTAYKNIFKVLPGEQVNIDLSGSNFSIYWDISTKEAEASSADAAADTLESLIKDAIKLELRSDVPVGVFLSGGVDSSAITAVAAKLQPFHQLKTFTVDFVGKGGRDAEFADMISKKINSQHHLLSVTPEDQFAALNELIQTLDEPMSDSAIVPTYLISREAKKIGIKVLLSGAGADEIFGGYPRHYTSKIGSPTWFSNLPVIPRKCMCLFWRIINPAWSIRLSSAAKNFAVMISGVNLELMRKSMLNKDHYFSLLNEFEKDFALASSPTSYPLMLMDVKNYLPNNILALTDKATMSNSIEGRVPLLDHRLVEFALSLPEEINLPAGTEKGLFKKSLQDYLPPILLNRKKEGFNAPVHSWVDQWHDQIRNELFNNPTEEVNKLVDLTIIEQWLNVPKLRKRSADTLYSLYILNRWIRSRN